jgi:mannose-6-phosphate isomerase
MLFEDVIMTALPVRMPPAPIQHFYRGGDRIAALRGAEILSDHQPEEWLASTTTRFGEAPIGLSRTEDGILLRDLVIADPVAWVGDDRGLPGDTGVLVKLLDARQRLPVHVHPDRAFAGSHLDCPYGKTEAWFVLDTEGDSAFHLGWKRAVDRDELDRRRDAQDGEWMLANMHRIVAEPGMGVVVPAGTVHAIDGGIFVAEVQEPTDFSILLEWSVTTSTREESHLDLGFDAVMPAVSVDAFSEERLNSVVTRTGGRDHGRLDKTGPDHTNMDHTGLDHTGLDHTGLDHTLRRMLSPAADPFFRLRGTAAVPETPSDPVETGFGVVLVTEGSGALVSDAGKVDVTRGEVYAVPHGFGPWRLTGDAKILLASPGDARVQATRPGASASGTAASGTSASGTAASGTSA